MLDPKIEVQEAAERVRNALTRLGHCYQTKRGDLIEISYRQLALVGTKYGLLEIDVHRLPPRVSIDKLTRKETLHDLTAVVGRPVHKLNTTGLTYCIDLQPAPKQSLPKTTRLEMGTRPPGQYMIPIGQGAAQAEWRSLLDTSHILVGGESRSGKSTWLNAVLASLLTTYTQDELRLALIDPKGVEFTPYAGVPHLVKPVAIMPHDAAAVTSWLMREMDLRRDLFAQVFARNLPAYNNSVRQLGDADRGASPLPLLLAVIDEVTDIALECGLNSSFYQDLIRLSSKGAAFGLILILATQNPKAEVLNTLIRGNMSTRVAFRVSSAEHSRTILGRTGAQDLPRSVRGRLMARLDESLIELQGFYVPDQQILALAHRWQRSEGPRLSPIERSLVLHAQQQLDGFFPIGKLYQRFKGQISHRKLVKLGQRWEQNGWLEPPASVVQGRRVTDELRRVALRSEAQ